MDAAHQQWDVPYPDLSHIVTEDDTPVDNVFSEKQQRLLTEPLYASGEHLQPFLALANVGLFFSPEQPPYVPDAMLSLGVQVPADLWDKKGRSYFIWVYGKPPDVVVEIVSNRDGHEERKILDYARLGIGYYVIYDPSQFLSQRPLRAFQLHGTHYVPLADSRVLPGLPVGLKLWDGCYETKDARWLRWVDEDGNLLGTGRERAEQERERAEQERERAEQERERAEQEHQRAEQEHERAERLAARLRELGVDPKL